MDRGAGKNEIKHSETDLHKVVENLKGLVMPFAITTLCQPSSVQ
jgi:hypothetical protein